MTVFELGVADGIKLASVSQFLAGTFGPPKAREDMNLILSKAQQGHPRAKDVLQELRTLELASSDPRVQKDVIEIVSTEAEILRGKRLQVLPKISPETAQKLVNARREIAEKLVNARRSSRNWKGGLVAAGLLAGYGAYRSMKPKRYDDDRV